jgi:PHD/YefM family antitoxin component YafN of YafNO toxin-antitoxin module
MEIIMVEVSANELKTKGISSLSAVIEEQKAAVITVRGKNKYVVMDFETYNHLRECELEAAVMETRMELEAGDVFTDTVEEHIRRIRDAL